MAASQKLMDRPGDLSRKEVHVPIFILQSRFVMPQFREFVFRAFFVFLSVWTGTVWAIGSDELLPPEQAFRASAKLEGDEALIGFDIADGYYLYRQKFKFASKDAGVDLGEPVFPKGETKHDEFFGEMEIYRGHLDIRLPLVRRDAGAAQLVLDVTSQGCADVGVCYPPYKQTLKVHWPASGAGGAADSLGKLAEAFKSLGVKTRPVDLLPPDEAFRFFAEVKDANTLWVSWQIADGYYLYREKFKLALPGASGVTLGNYRIPNGEPKHDEEFGDVEVFHREVGFAVPLSRAGGEPGNIRLQANYQGCAEKGVCYPPMQKTVGLDLPAAGAGTTVSMANPVVPVSEQDRIAFALQSDSAWATVLSFLGFGLLLAFTPCIFPMIPILSGIIVGQGHTITTGRAFMLSLSYVLASALAYTVFGILAGLFGSNLQILFQKPEVIVAFSALFVLLALSMFGVYTLQMPEFIQARVVSISNQQRGGTLTGAAIMGALSALIVGPCVAAPLAGALIYIGQTGDAVLGGLALFALGLGMGIPLLVIGASAGKLLPKAGIWMNAVKAVFGVGLLAIAVWLLERILPSAVSMFLWALLLIIPAIYLGALEALPHPVSGWRRLWKGVGIVMLTYGVLLLIGVASDSTDPLQPLRGIYPTTAKASTQSIAFRKVRNVDDLSMQVAAAEATGKWVMLDFYADWCISCKEMERYTFADPKVQSALSNVVLLQADVTQNSADDQALLQHFGLIGPPATLFFGPDREERKTFRVVGYMGADEFLGHLQRVLQ
ncbi:thiol:disulfide interchange protein DsbD [Methylocaldum marinum]|uniref:Thiol:disulfide interchange protein DsbD n=1 Tax=Methylocaldum marinum TaxID=1432792 RepID=A0A250KRT1_9GAMM|nr:protein-disulfide reductase DsbD [Methylocaldum marinum]BBA34393.1 thiol:disulfide interchange protein DsbD [Methylocaldum marinum]